MKIKKDEHEKRLEKAAWIVFWTAVTSGIAMIGVGLYVLILVINKFL